MKFESINRNRQRAQNQLDHDRIQEEIRYAKQIKSQTGCSWTDALRSAKQSLEQQQGYPIEDVK